MNYSKIPLAQIIVQSLKNWGIDQVVISPGSRNAPLIISLTSDQFFTCYSIVDERCAAFFALGIAQKRNQPAVLCCTSGSALLNYYPAIAEAYYSQIPLVILSADRPYYGIDIGDGQTIRQHEVYGNHIEHSAAFLLDNREDKLNALINNVPSLRNKFKLNNQLEQEEINAENAKSIDHALSIVNQHKRPVHCNLPFEEPLYIESKAPSIPIFLKKDILTAPTLPVPAKNELILDWQNSGSIMILIGVLKPNKLAEPYLEWLTSHNNVILLTETTSNIQNKKAIYSIDQIIAPIEESNKKESLFQNLKPDLLITIGGMIVSKKVKTFLRKYRPNKHIHIGKTKAYDTFYLGVRHLNYEINHILKELKSNINISHYSTFQKTWLAMRDNMDIAKKKYIDSAPYSDFLVFDSIMKSIPDKTNIHLSNSSTVRYSQLFPLFSGQTVYCNRGTSGIDGSTSTAIGSSIHDSKPSLMISGDLSFFYDSNALWNKYIRNDFRIIVINNGGGGIFRILPGVKHNETFETFFETKHQLKSISLCEMYGLEYRNADSLEILEDELKGFFSNSESPRLLEIFTPSKVNDQVLMGYFGSLKEAID